MSAADPTTKMPLSDRLFNIALEAGAGTTTITSEP